MQWILNKENKELQISQKGKPFRPMEREAAINIKCRDCAHLTKESSCARRLNVSDVNKVKDCNWFKRKVY